MQSIQQQANQHHTQHKSTQMPAGQMEQPSGVILTFSAAVWQLVGAREVYSSEGGSGHRGQPCQPWPHFEGDTQSKTHLQSANSHTVLLSRMDQASWTNLP